MNARMTATVLAAAATIALGAPASADPGDSPLPVYAFHEDGVFAWGESNGREVWVAAWRSMDGAAFGCVELYAPHERRADFGCGPLGVDVDPVLRHATVRGTIESEVYSLRSRRSGGDSTLTIDITLTAGGDPSAGVSQGSGAGNVWAGAGGSAGVSQPQTGRFAVQSGRLCAGLAGCSPSAEGVAEGSAFRYAGAYAWAGEGGDGCSGAMARLAGAARAARHPLAAC